MNKIAVIRRNGLGDLICAVPLVLLLQQKYPNAAITLFVDKRNAPLIPYLPCIREVVVFSAKGNKYWNHLRLALRFRRQFDLAISAKTSPMKLTNFFLYWLKAKKSIAYVDKSQNTPHISDPLFYDPEMASKTHQALKCLHTIAPEFTDVPQEFYPRLHVPENIKKAYPLAGTLRDSSAGPIVLVSSTTTKEANRFDPVRYASILNQLYEITPFFTLIVGEKKDAIRASQIYARLRMPSQMVFPRNFDEFMVLLDAGDLYFVGDGGVAHIGAALGKKMVALFGETNPKQWRPLSNEAEVFYHPKHVDFLSDNEILNALKEKIAQPEV